MYPHRIRLRGPWEYEPLARQEGQTDDLPPPGRMVLPCRWREGGLGEFAGRVRFRRRFGYPGRLDPHERVWLTFAGIEGDAAISLNGQFLGRRGGASGPFEFEGTPLLQPRNELIVEVEAAGNGGLWGEVAMEIRATAFLRAVRTWADEGSRLHVAGEVVGTCERPLEVYVLLDRSNIAYATVEATPAGKPFQVITNRSSEAALPSQTVRVELVHVSTVWYAVACPTPAGSSGR